MLKKSNLKSIIANNLDAFHKLDLEYNLVMHNQKTLMENQRDITILTNAEGEKKLKDIFKKEAEVQGIIGHIGHINTCSTAMEIALMTARDSGKVIGMGDVKTINEIVEEERGITITNFHKDNSYILPNLSNDLPKKRNSNYTKPKKKRKKK